MIPDVNVLVAAFRDDHHHHVPARSWLSQAIESCGAGGTIEVLPMVAVGFLRVVTNDRVFRIPASQRQAQTFLDSLLSVEGVSMPLLGPEWSGLEALCIELDVVGEDVADAWIAAAVNLTGQHLVTFDRDFVRLLRPGQYTLLSSTSRVSEARAIYEAELRASIRRGLADSDAGRCVPQEQVVAEWGLATSP